MSAVAHVVGARPNFVKAAPVIRALSSAGVSQVVIHTGQHYDAALSDIFFRDLGLPEPDLNLGVGSGSHAEQTAALMVELERAFCSLRPSLAVVYGDVNSTLAAALVAAKLLLPVAHVEAGLRSFDNTMPEETNRRVTDILSDILFVTSPEGMTNLGREGIDAGKLHHVGNPMIDTLMANLGRFDTARMRRELAIGERYAVATLHRPGNVDTPEAARLGATALVALSQLVEVVFPVHPRGRARLHDAGLVASDRLHLVEPLGYLDFMSLVQGAALVLTDSGGIQEETTALRVPCLTIRPNTERPITITHGTNRLVAPTDVASAARSILADGVVTPAELPPLWDGHAGERIARILERRVAAAPPAG
jgi:UDP-N-acetylglucosamine 2-epimerase (non-hydrolysing)